MVTAAQLRQLYYAKPFRAFVLVLEDGRRVTIPEAVRFGIAEEIGKVVFAGKRAIESAPFESVRIEPLRKASRRRRKAS